MDKLPALVFGNTRSSVEFDVDRYSHRLACIITSLQYYECVGPAADFRSKSCLVDINGMRLVANANTPVRVAVGDGHDLTLMVPFLGQNESIAAGKTYPWHAGESAMLFLASGRAGGSSTRSNLNIDLQPERLQATARAMLGLDADAHIALGIENFRNVALNYGKVNFSALLRQHCQTIDSLLDTPDALAHLGVDEAIYRTVVMMLRPELFLPDPAAQPTGQTHDKRRKLDRVCEYIVARLGDTLPLTDLGCISGMSRRSLQIAFQERYQCTPMQWITEQKLLTVHARLSNAKPGDIVTALAIAYFPNLG